MEPGRDLGGVAAAQLVHIQVGGDDHGLDGHHSVVEQAVQCGSDELSGHLRSEIVQNQKIAARQLGRFPAGVFAGTEFRLLQLGEQVAGSFVNNAVAPVGHRSGDARRQEGLSKTRSADEQQIPGIGREGRGIPAANVQRPLHNGAGAGAVFGVNGVGVVVQPELAEGFPAVGQHANFLFLLLTAQLA
mgnify:CR=1 FL=1